MRGGHFMIGTCLFWWPGALPSLHHRQGCLACAVSGPGAPPARLHRRLFAAAAFASCLLGSVGVAHAVDATWDGPGAEWTTGTNWSSGSVPNGTATFTGNVPTSLTISNNTSINTIQFNAGAPAYQFTIEQPTSANFLITGTGIVNSSANAPTFIDNFYMDFLNGSSAGNANITNNSSGTLHFDNTSTAGNAIITNNSTLEFDGSSTAGNATITTNNVVLGRVVFNNNSTAGNAQFITNAGGYVDFSNTSGPGGNHQVSAGSIAGAGNYFLGANRLTVGTNDLSTAVSGAISDGGLAGGAGASLVKVGTGTLTLSGANTYSGATTINGGALEVDGSIASSSVTVNAGGTLTGIGVVDPITTTINSGGTFAPGTAGVPGTSITITGNLALQSGATYQVYLNPSTSTYAAVNGAAALAGTVNASFAAGNYVAKQYTILTTTGGLTGTFASLTNTNLPSGTSDSLSYSPDDVYLNLTPGFVNYTGLNQNQRNVANALTNYFNSTGGIPSAFFGLTPGGLTQIDGEAATGAERGAFQLTTEFLNLMLDPFVYGRGGWGGGGERERRSDRLHARRAGKLAAGCRARLCLDPQGPGEAGLRSALDRVGLGFRRQQHHGRRSGGRFDHGHDTDLRLCRRHGLPCHA